ncbi:glycoside hydrolase family 64 protein [Amycolatopsis saalfeldensis]|uniref:Beta-1,3-glucanase n=1 Tax=Amycolatopsis saalfeldensis TaxID=394193 RepID=A0A1H8UKK9_9PSEU|nr:glycoside hydrolase family 64 protein [Amycolatopsis saalfeldensis]SEP03752.1 Beta-1,3-glucanase [Amycolatopsis saalfeldensis]
MISRRAFLGASAAAATFPLWGKGFASAATPDTFKLAFDDQTGAGATYAYVTGTTLDGKLVVLKADGTPYYPPSPAAQTPLAEDCAIPIKTLSQVTVPKMAGARVTFATDAKLDFFVNPGPALVPPSFVNTDDVNYNRNWSFCEFTFNNDVLFANISYVDFVAFPLGLHLTTTGSGDQTVSGLPAKSLDSIADALKAQGGAWTSLIEAGPDGTPLRALSAHYRADQFSGYLDGYIDQVWQKYAGTDLTVDTQVPGLGVFTGRVGSDGVLKFNNGEAFTKPVTADVWSCDSGPFAIKDGDSDARKAIIPRLAAALNRTTLLDNANQPTGEDPAKFYQAAETNHYARIVHSKLPDNRGYAFPYDDVSPGPDFSGAVQAGDPDTLTVTVNALR